MKRSGIYLIFALLIVLSAVILVKCDSADSRHPRTAADSARPKGPAPDNNSANNPSLADTNYEKDRTQPITDTMKKK